MSMYSYRKLGFIFRPVMSDGKGTDKKANTQEEKRGDNQEQPPAQYVVAEEYTIGVPLFRVKPGLLKILHSVGASGEIFTKKEICLFLKNYISSRHLYDPVDPRIVYCKDDPLQKLFGVEKFTIHDALNLISNNCNQVPDTCIKRKCHYVTRPVHSNHANTLPVQPFPSTLANSNQPSVPTASSFRIEVCRASPIISSSTGLSSHTKQQSNTQHLASGSSLGTVGQGQDGKVKRGSKRKRKDRSSSESSEGKIRPASVSITYSDAESTQNPWQVSVKMETSDDESEVLSFQEAENQQRSAEEEEVLSVEVNSDTFSVEYEVESDNTEKTNDSDSSDNISGQDVLVLCQDSDVEFCADMSDGGETDTELTDADKWSCSVCETKNPPLERHCSLCWKLRPGWLPDKKSKFGNKSRSSSVPGEMSSSESSDIGRRHSFSKKRRSLSQAARFEYSSDSSVDRYSKMEKDSFDSGIGTASATQPSSQETDMGTKYLQESEDKFNVLEENFQEKRCIEKLGLEPGACRFPQSAEPMSPQSKLGIRRTFLNYRSKEDLCFNVSDKNRDVLVGSLKSPSKKQKTLTDEGVKEKAAGLGSLASATGGSADMCVICLCRPKTGSIIHGSTGHQVCCFRCARRLKRKRLFCPVCRRPIQKVVKNFIL